VAVNATSPFGKYAGIVAAIAALVIILVWVGAAAGVGDLVTTPQLDAAFYIVLGVVFGTGAGALVVANGVGRQATAANDRLDAMHAPSAPVAKAMVARSAAETVAVEAGLPPSPPPPPPEVG
jgi:hypothetical protein